MTEAASDDAWPGKVPLLDRIAADYREAVREADHWHGVCAAWTKSFGLGIWRERHPADVHKLCMRRRSRDYVRQILASGAIAQALALHEFEGRAQ